MSARTEWNASAGAIDPALVPQRRLYTGEMMPGIGLGTFGSDYVPLQAVADAVKAAAGVGFRHFDCASVYGNEAFIGNSFRELFASGLDREEIWVTSKLWNDKHGEHDVIPACQKSLADLGLQYLDMYLVHWPFPNHHPPGCDVGSRSSLAQPYMHDNYMRTWRKMEELVDRGLVRHIGTSNMTIPKLRLLLRDARIKPAINEMEIHPHFQQTEFFHFLLDNDIEPVAFSPLGSPARPERDRTPEDTSPIEDPVIVEIARKHQIHPANVCIKWAVQRGQTPIPFSVNRSHFLSNLQAAVIDPLTAEEMTAIEKMDRNCRLIKGQVFLWKENQSWEDLWDLNGEITPN